MIFVVEIELPKEMIKISDFINVQEILIVSTTSSVCGKTGKHHVSRTKQSLNTVKKKASYVFTTIFLFSFPTPFKTFIKCLRQHTKFHHGSEIFCLRTPG